MFQEHGMAASNKLHIKHSSTTVSQSEADAGRFLLWKFVMKWNTYIIKTGRLLRNWQGIIYSSSWLTESSLKLTVTLITYPHDAKHQPTAQQPTICNFLSNWCNIHRSSQLNSHDNSDHVIPNCDQFVLARKPTNEWSLMNIYLASCLQAKICSFDTQLLQQQVSGHNESCFLHSTYNKSQLCFARWLTERGVTSNHTHYRSYWATSNMPVLLHSVLFNWLLSKMTSD